MTIQKFKDNNVTGRIDEIDKQYHLFLITTFR